MSRNASFPASFFMTLVAFIVAIARMKVPFLDNPDIIIASYLIIIASLVFYYLEAIAEESDQAFAAMLATKSKSEYWLRVLSQSLLLSMPLFIEWKLVLFCLALILFHVILIFWDGLVFKGVRTNPGAFAGVNNPTIRDAFALLASLALSFAFLVYWATDQDNIGAMWEWFKPIASELSRFNTLGRRLGIASLAVYSGVFGATISSVGFRRIVAYMRS